MVNEYTWNPIAESLPEPSMPVLVYNENHPIKTVHEAHTYGGRFYSLIDHGEIECTHWCEYPKIPE